MNQEWQPAYINSPANIGVQVSGKCIPLVYRQSDGSFLRDTFREFPRTSRQTNILKNCGLCQSLGCELPFKAIKLVRVGGWCLGLLHSGVDFAVLSSKLKLARVLSNDAGSKQLLKVVPLTGQWLEPGGFLLAAPELSGGLCDFTYPENTRVPEAKTLSALSQRIWCKTYIALHSLPLIKLSAHLIGYM